MAKTGRKRNSPEGTRNQMSFVVEDETLNRFMEAKDVLQNSMPEALQTVKITKVDEILKNKKVNLEEKITEKGINFSGGEKQRINIARSLYKDFDILILDESTNSLNEKLEEEIINNIIRYCNNKILIVCSHNLSLKKFFSNELHIDKLRIN